ncbi:MAG: hypothetical protein ACLPXM_09790 [Terriglobales bacterium]
MPERAQSRVWIREQPDLTMMEIQARLRRELGLNEGQMVEPRDFGDHGGERSLHLFDRARRELGPRLRLSYGRQERGPGIG